MHMCKGVYVFAYISNKKIWKHGLSLQNQNGRISDQIYIKVKFHKIGNKFVSMISPFIINQRNTRSLIKRWKTKKQKHTASSGRSKRSSAKYPLLVSTGIIDPAPPLGFSSLLDIRNLYFGRILRSASDAPSYFVTEETTTLSSCKKIDIGVVVTSSFFIPVLQQHKELQLCMASSNREQFQSNMPKQHKIWQRRRRMPEKPQTTCKNSESENPAVIFCKKYRIVITREKAYNWIYNLS